MAMLIHELLDRIHFKPHFFFGKHRSIRIGSTQAKQCGDQYRNGIIRHREPEWAGIGFVDFMFQHRFQ